MFSQVVSPAASAWVKSRSRDAQNIVQAVTDVVLRLGPSQVILASNKPVLAAKMFKAGNQTMCLLIISLLAF